RMTTRKHIKGRYAPSPTGNLHVGNLRTALLAWLHSRLQGGQFTLRMEDLDTPRTVPGSADQILRDLEWLGLDWDGEVVYQSTRQDLYQAAVSSLQEQGLVYECFCSRKDIRQAISAPHAETSVYPRTCFGLTSHQLQERRQVKSPSLRIDVGKTKVSFIDQCLGQQRENLAAHVGDFIVKRADGLFAYQLAVVVDDMEQGISDVVRGADLLGSTARQIYLAQKLSASTQLPNYCHVPLMLDQKGARMAKRDGSDSAGQWRAGGGSAATLVGELAASIGLLPNVEAITAAELCREMDFHTMISALRNDSQHQAKQ
ncbi:MAG: tRNA glutamyl-Q(34) synthetase GluQRS, partial [Gammaproteobacteria bacterium]|nr:tRNA glutamyl-Q(34) synthetase GluQRS [Gammaproteobacteria bacterium]